MSARSGRRRHRHQPVRVGTRRGRRDGARGGFPALAGLADVAEQPGGPPVSAPTSDPAEWALDNPGHPDAAEARALAREHREQWLRGYRNVLGFATLVLRRT